MPAKARKWNAKTVQAVDSKGAGKSAGMKRAIGNSNSEPPKKRRKAQAAATEDTIIPEADKVTNAPWVIDPDQVFRFLDLPGELRNRIYGMAIEWSFRSFPRTHEKPKKSRRRNAVEEKAAAITQARPLPYIGLTQVCSLIRTEFRPLWLSTHQFPLFALEGYFKAFFPVLRGGSRLNEDVRKRIKSYSKATGTLRLWVRMDCLKHVDVLPLLKFRHRFPEYTITPQPAPFNVDTLTIDSFTAFMNTSHATWVRYIKQHRITQIKLQVSRYTVGPSNLPMRIVLKEKDALGWMGSGLISQSHLVEEYKRFLGLDPSWGVTFAVDYS
ncbi:uncharacterized protein J4E84_000231 [Alternaria hordeiaustralica]|uniref:uncharacterized protein n=1 Tax=Alternaria hordeiaustralica TaxID=1187925 RepID=UPI0020C1F81F|nr:uncharacterized protein J4E84_000231 [Alternaria hordeiaustralica]KAI4697106.1 hypothetical protein J4E84_000231 [Alternaria hordeiaustralica]